ncbi:MotA/TolQ/ExbB proton channel family protein [Allorhodopirellula heiligendammensis]|uniref:Biopolymer transport protein ExbB n=1 Tax=Allorhodopirellula heiligendammensis TaxID=2714739 RepID=A0A5C6BYJ8_9BACT|nr:MotA/TolQ/ExbB proton channel family protein [Allorhodopirellula heiligendammensis]TWU17005.1 Biopolymer transport protein ExbB [Allorhodopirellula heiligendammensis]
MKSIPALLSDAFSRRSLASWLAIFVIGVSLSSPLAISTAIAQDDAAAEFGGGDDVEPPAEQPVDAGGDAVAGQEAAGEADGGQADANGAAETQKKDQSLLTWFIKSLGIPYVIVFLALSVTLVSLFVMNMLAARRDTLCPHDLVEEFGQRLDENDNQGAYDLAKNDESVLGQVLAAGLAKVSRGYPKALEGMQEVGEEESMKLEHRLSYMALIGNLSPMIGLFGTVQGMIASFQVIANGGTTPEPSALAEGISTALFTTLVGLFIAIPAIAAYNILRNRVARLLLEVGVESENLMSRFEDTTPKTGAR